MTILVDVVETSGVILVLGLAGRLLGLVLPRLKPEPVEVLPEDDEEAELMAAIEKYKQVETRDGWRLREEDVQELRRLQEQLRLHRWKRELRRKAEAQSGNSSSRIQTLGPGPRMTLLTTGKIPLGWSRTIKNGHLDGTRIVQEFEVEFRDEKGNVRTARDALGHDKDI